MYFSVRKCTPTCWARFSISRNGLGNRAEVKDISTLRPAPSTEFRGGSCCNSQMGWRPHICKILPGCITAHSKTHISLHATMLVWWLGLAADEDWDWGFGEWKCLQQAWKLLQMTTLNHVNVSYMSSG